MTVFSSNESALLTHLGNLATGGKSTVKLTLRGAVNELSREGAVLEEDEQ